MPVDTVEGIVEIYFEEHLATGLTVSFSPLSDCVDGCFPAHADANSNKRAKLPNSKGFKGGFTIWMCLKIGNTIKKGN